MRFLYTLVISFRSTGKAGETRANTVSRQDGPYCQSQECYFISNKLQFGFFMQISAKPLMGPEKVKHDK